MVFLFDGCEFGSFYTKNRPERTNKRMRRISTFEIQKILHARIEANKHISSYDMYVHTFAQLAQQPFVLTHEFRTEMLSTSNPTREKKE